MSSSETDKLKKIKYVINSYKKENHNLAKELHGNKFLIKKERENTDKIKIKIKNQDDIIQQLNDKINFLTQKTVEENDELDQYINFVATQLSDKEKNR